MEAVNGLLTGFGVILTPSNLYLCFLGSLIGTLVGVLPGVGPLAALALLVGVAFVTLLVAAEPRVACGDFAQRRRFIAYVA